MDWSQRQIVYSFFNCNSRVVMAFNPDKNTYTWDDGSTNFNLGTQTYSDGGVWRKGEPSGFDEHCYDVFDMWSDLHPGLNDEGCNNSRKSICEKRGILF